MFKLTLHARIEIAAVAVLLLGSCGQSAYQRFTVGDYERLEIADVNARNAIARVDSLEGRISDIESRLNM